MAPSRGSDTARAGQRPRAGGATIYRYRPGERKGVRDVARRGFRWCLPLRSYLISLLASLLIFLMAVAILYGLAPPRALQSEQPDVPKADV